MVIPKMEDYPASMRGELPESPPEQYCQQGAVNALLGHFALLCREDGIAFSCRVSIPPDLAAQPLNLGSIRATVERYHGWHDARCEGGVFTLRALL